MNDSKRIIAHIGLGAFHRAHQAWFTQNATDAQHWSIVAFTGRSAKAADELNAQNCNFTLVERSAEGDRFEPMDIISDAYAAQDELAFIETIADPRCTVVTLTITEAAYGMDSNGNVDLANPPAALRKLTHALAHRAQRDAGPINIVPCDNMPSNGRLMKIAMGQLVTSLEPSIGDWLENNVSFISTSVDRITPKTTDQDIALVLEKTGFADRSPVITEPFKSWVLSNDFGAPCPDWASAGAEIVDEVEPFEKRKLWLLNGAHSILAYAGLLNGHETVDQAIADAECRALVLSFWREACEQLNYPGLALERYKSQLLERFENPRISHRLEQIAIDGATKLAVRVAPIIEARMASDASVDASIEALCSWIRFVENRAQVQDAKAHQIESAKSTPGDRERVAALIAIISEPLAQNQAFIDRIQLNLEGKKFNQDGNRLPETRK